MNWFDCFDEFVISLFERFCHVTTRLAGLDSVFWERLSIAGFVILYAFGITMRGHEPWWFWLLVSVIFVFKAHRFAMSPRRQRFDSTMNINKITERRTRMISWLQVFLMVLITHYDPVLGACLVAVAWACDLIAYYFAACDDLPPSEAFKFWKTVQASLQTVENMG